MDKKKVTVVTVTYNLIKGGREAYFRQCLESVYNQNYDNIEHLVIDGASNDGSLELIQEYAEKGWIKYISEPDDGIYYAMNKGIEMATGDYIAFLNSDDYWHDENAVQAAVSVFAETECDFCAGNANYIDEKNPEKNFIRYADLSHAFSPIPFCHQAMFCKVDVMKNLGMFDLTYKSASDYDFIIRLFLNKYKGAVIPLTFTTFRMGWNEYY